MKYEIIGDQLPVVNIKLDMGERITCEAGSMTYMSDDMVMETHTGGGVGKMFGRMFSGESLFLNSYICNGNKGEIGLSSSFMGSILPFEITPGKSIICQKSAYLASMGNVELSVYLQKKLGAGFFGGEGFIMQKLSGNGIAFVEVDGHVIEKTLLPNENIVVNTGSVAVIEETVKMDIRMVKGAKNMFFGGEGLFNTILTGPGKVYLQSIPRDKLAKSIEPFIVTKN
ncbi:MAG: TIGR00266 family protein [Acutalibacteraceae bacterium]